MTVIDSDVKPDTPTAARLTASATLDEIRPHLGTRSRGFAPNPLDHVRAEQTAARAAVLREVERTASRAGLR